MTASRSSGAREHVLARIRGALSQSGTDRVEIPREYRTVGPWKPGAADTIELLVDRLVDYKAIVHRATDAAELTTAITESLGAPTTLTDGPLRRWSSRSAWTPAGSTRSGPPGSRCSPTAAPIRCRWTGWTPRPPS